MRTVEEEVNLIFWKIVIATFMGREIGCTYCCPVEDLLI